jgi:hypothetical protein
LICNRNFQLEQLRTRQQHYIPADGSEGRKVQTVKLKKELTQHDIRASIAGDQLFCTTRNTSINISTKPAVTVSPCYNFVSARRRNMKDIVTYIPIARQRLGKHSLAGANARNNRTSIARQLISKHACLTIEAVFSAWSVQSRYKEVFGSIEKAETIVEWSFQTPARQGMSLGAEELN